MEVFILNVNMEKTIVSFLKEKLSSSLIYLFGSTVKGTVHNGSDIDIAFLSEKKLDTYDLFMMAQELAEKLEREVDLIDLSQASTVFQAQIIQTGKVIYCNNETEKAQFEMKTLKMYAKLNEDRSEILLNIEGSGSIYEK